MNAIKTVIALSIVSVLAGCAVKHESKFTAEQKTAAMNELKSIHNEMIAQSKSDVAVKIADAKARSDRKIKAETNLVYGAGVRGSKDPVSAYYNNVHEFLMTRGEQTNEEKNEKYIEEIKRRIDICAKFDSFIKKYANPIIAKYRDTPYGGDFWYLDEFQGYSVEPEIAKNRHPYNANRASSMIAIGKNFCEGVNLFGQVVKK
ncbi:hypothetical protein [Enterobacter kobei]|uniref:hypothetical protein n=1 Tax=Enterobacter kobei TaxID=208224 RepID=UPI00201FFB1C|nr:hypothetical protein [Enterobacter kobei]MCL8167145.1 hypothetical protein [Enterobacter kobei]MCM7795641.1 hypothetical protein [Enterobacter kobei]